MLRALLCGRDLPVHDIIWALRIRSRELPLNILNVLCHRKLLKDYHKLPLIDKYSYPTPKFLLVPHSPFVLTAIQDTVYVLFGGSGAAAIRGILFTLYEAVPSISFEVPPSPTFEVEVTE